MVTCSYLSFVHSAVLVIPLVDVDGNPAVSG